MVRGQVPHETVFKLQTGLPHLKAELRLEGAPFQLGSLLWLLVGGLSSSRAPPQRCLSVLTTWQLALSLLPHPTPPQWFQTARRSFHVFYALVSRDTPSFIIFC